MIDNLLILPDTDGADALSVQRRGDRLTVTRDRLSVLQTDLTAPYAVILPGQHVRAFLTDVPTSLKGSERLNVARFAHEDRLACAPTDLHIVMGGGDPVATLMVSPEVMDAVLDRLDPHAIYADFDALADLGSDRDVHLLDRIVTPGPQGSAVDPDWAEGPAETRSDEALAQVMFDRLNHGDALNLRAGEYRRRTPLQAGPWYRVAAAAILCAGLGLGLALADARATNAQAEALRVEARLLYEQATGEVAPQPLSRLARSAPAGETNSQAFLDLSDILFRALSEHPDIRVERLSFETGEESLRLRLIYPGFQSAGDLEGSVSALGGRFIPGGVREQNGRFIGDAALIRGVQS